MDRTQPAVTARPHRRRLSALALALALTLGAIGADAPALGAAQPGAPSAAQTAPVEALPAHLDCWIAGVDDAAMPAYGIDPLAEPRCASGRALDLRVLRDRLGHP